MCIALSQTLGCRRTKSRDKFDKTLLEQAGWCGDSPPVLCHKTLESPTRCSQVSLAEAKLIFFAAREWGGARGGGGVCETFARDGCKEGGMGAGWSGGGTVTAAAAMVAVLGKHGPHRNRTPNAGLLRSNQNMFCLCAL